MTWTPKQREAIEAAYLKRHRKVDGKALPLVLFCRGLGLSLRRVAAILDAAGIPTPNSASKSDRVYRWSAEAVRHILQRQGGGGDGTVRENLAGAPRRGGSSSTHKRGVTA